MTSSLWAWSLGPGWLRIGSQKLHGLAWSSLGSHKASLLSHSLPLCSHKSLPIFKGHKPHPLMKEYQMIRGPRFKSAALFPSILQEHHQCSFQAWDRLCPFLPHSRIDSHHSTDTGTFFAFSKNLSLRLQVWSPFHTCFSYYAFLCSTQHHCPSNFKLLMDVPH